MLAVPKARALVPCGLLLAASFWGACGDDGPSSDRGFDASMEDAATDSGVDAGLVDAAVDLGVDAFVPPDMPPDLFVPPSASCAGICDGRAPAGCGCGAECTEAGDCCGDYSVECGLEAELRAELTAGHITRGYTAARDLMYGITGSVDVIEGEVECVYTGATAVADGTRTPEDRFNTEHVWPRSFGEPSGSAGDIYNLRPTLAEANTQRSNNPFGDTVCESFTCPYANGGSERGVDELGAQVWEVRPETRGDIARAIFYFMVRYRLDLDAAQESTLRGWHTDDPPSPEEIARVDRIEAVQGNRNAFTDRPELVDQIPDF